jgi:acyl-coenzyme A thioesterase PaaI-like protein
MRSLASLLAQGLELYDTYVGKGSIVSEIRWGQRAGGHRGILHGGAIAASFDDAFGALFFSQGFGPGFTANLTIDYRRPVPVGTRLRIVATVDSVEGRKVWMLAKLVDSSDPSDDPTVFAEAKCLFIKPRVPKAATTSLPSAYKAPESRR